ncbi:A24 family peptidase [Actinacidiphila sp. ITFR-21]|uniref:A24 family peptidase n=1 Tax=Actinacidiphila sp. ITFR-21 TaxID=3075199 RepID=UPI00288C099C|nr:A24 family peptidase [Streptomyces sp. ITFR-21]WNI17478.1 A24 family peptidase [Streptomyces sp. ITFR-21]
MPVYLILAAAVWGTAAGALLPRAAYRLAVPAERPWADLCPSGHPLGGWFGPARCAVPGCPTPRYGPGYGAGSACALGCVAVALAAGAHPETAVWLLLVPAGLLLARVDLLVFRLPDILTLPALGGTAALLGLAALLPSHQGSWPRALTAAAALGALYFALFFANPAGMGFGDVKLAPTLGLALGWYGWPAVVAGTFAGFLLAAVTGLALVAARRATRRTPIPFGPFMLLGALAGLLFASG